MSDLRRLSARGIELLKRLESVESHVYLDEAGLPTIGVGHLILASEVGLPPKATAAEIERAAKALWPRGWSPAQIDMQLRHDLGRFEAAVNELVHVPLSQEQFDALTIFAFNIGISTSRFRSCSALHLLNAGRYDAVPDAMRLWSKVTVKGRLVESPGLKRRREAEITLWNSSPPKA